MSFYKPSEKEVNEQTQRLNDMLEGKNQTDIFNLATCVEFEGYLIEKQSTKGNSNIANNGYLSHSTSISRLTMRGFEDHLPAWLQMKIIIDCENKMPSESLRFLGQNMSTHMGEWTCNLIETRQDMIRIYHNNIGLTWNNENGTYSSPPESRAWVNCFAYERKNLEQSVFLSIDYVKDKVPLLIEHLYSRPYDDLPDSIKNNATIRIPPEGAIYPLARGFMNANSIIHYDTGKNASRGCKKKE